MAASKSDILLCTLNSTYQHAAFGLRYIKANLGELSERCTILEATIKENSRNFVERVLKLQPRIVGFSVYIWNTTETLDCIMTLKKVAPHITIVLGGPEISYETEKQEHCKWTDYIIKGEADFSFYNLCNEILIHQNFPTTKIIAAELPDIKKIQFPYDLYTDEDIKNRIVYVEASRGCPYKCEYCLSSLDKSVRSFNTELFLLEMKKLLDRGVRTFKFVDRTFNLSPTTSTQILKFFLEHINLGLFLHFELVPDRLPVEIRELISKFPQGSLQFEIGLQTLNPVVAKNVSRLNDLTKVAQNFEFLRQHTHVHTHADLIVGLPGETIESFAAGFDQLSAFSPDEIQVGILKLLKGTPISRHTDNFKMVYSEKPPFQILSNSHMDYFTLQKMNRFAKFWDLYANSGEFKNFMHWLKNKDGSSSSLFSSFMNFVDYLSESFSETHSLSLLTLSEKAWSFMQQQGVEKDEASEVILNDYSFGNKRRDIPVFIKNQNYTNGLNSQVAQSLHNRRQIKHITSH